MKKIWGVRSSIVGDTVICLPVVNFLKRKYPDSYLYFVIDRGWSQCAPMFINHPKIDKIKITDIKRGYGKTDFDIMRECDIVINCSPPSLSPYWWNKDGLNLIHATWVMAGMELEDFFSLPEEEQYPKLYRWWDKEPYGDKHIALWPFAAYGKGGHRNPKPEQWQELIDILIIDGYTINHFGWHEDPSFAEHERYINHTKYSFFEQIKRSLNCSFALGIESGSTWSIAAYQEIPQLNLLCMSDHPHIQHKNNPLAYEPKGPLSFSNVTRDSFDNLNIDEVIESIKSI